MSKSVTLIKNVGVVLTDRVTDPTDLLIKKGKIAAIQKEIEAPGATVIDGNGNLLLPGFVDIHVHGGGGADFMDGTPEAFERVIKAHLAHGTTTLVPTAMTATNSELKDFISAYKAFKSNSPYASVAGGLHLEGPYFSKQSGKSKGAQSGDLIRDIDFAEVDELLALADGDIIRWDCAPEVNDSAKLARLLKGKGITCAVAHTNATAEQALQGFVSGFSHVTHFYNAVTAYMKREQKVTAGVVEAAYLDDSVTLELICDGRHVPKACLQLALKIKGADMVAGITDATRIAGTHMQEGMLGSLKNGTAVIVDDGVAKLPDMTSYAGSICTMDRALRVLCVDYGVDAVTAAKMLSTTPARLIGMDDTIGSVEIGKNADLVIADNSFNITAVIKNGKLA